MEEQPLSTYKVMSRNMLFYYLHPDICWHYLNAFFYYFAFKLVGTKFVYTRNEELPGKLFLQSKYGGKQEEIRRLQPDEAHKTLGCHISVDMSQEKQLEIVRDIILNWTRRINSSPLSTSDRMYAHKSILEKKLLYILPTCSFNYEQCRGLDKLLSKTLLNIHGIQRNCNRNVLYTSKEMGGLHIYSMYHLQGVSKIQFLFRHYRSNDTTGKLMKISMRYTQLETGLSKPYYSYNYYKAHFLATPTWHTNIWQYSSESHVRLRESDPWIYKPPRQNDFHLMDVVLRSNLTQEQKEIFNRVRLNLKLLTASDIVRVDKSTEIVLSVLNGVNNRCSTLNWPNVMTLPDKWMDIFCMVINQVIKPQLQSTPLGKWISQGHQRLYQLNTTTGKIVTNDEHAHMSDDQNKIVPDN